MTGDHELAVTEMLHHLDLVERHGAEGIVDVVLTTILGADAVAIAAQVGTDDMEVPDEPVCDAMPRHMRERIAMQQQERRTFAAMAQVNARATGFDLHAVGTFEQAFLTTTEVPERFGAAAYFRIAAAQVTAC